MIKKQLPLRVDFAGGWLDVPKFSKPDSYIVNCTISPLVSLTDWPYEKGGGLGGSAAFAILNGKDGIESELNLGVGWQDPAVILETGLCVWRSGLRPVLDCKFNPDFLKGKMALLWTGKNHVTFNNTDNARDYQKIIEASRYAKEAVRLLSFYDLCHAVELSYRIQLTEGMDPLPKIGYELARKYCGGGHGGYALYLFEEKKERDLFLKEANTLKIEPYSKPVL